MSEKARAKISLPRRTSAERPRFDQEKLLFQLLQILQGLEMAFINPAGNLSNDEYNAQCKKLIQQYQTMSLSKDPSFNLSKFSKQYNLSAPLAEHRLRTLKTSLQENFSSQGMAIVCYRIGQAFVTLVDNLELGITVKTELRDYTIELLNFFKDIENKPVNFQPVVLLSKWNDELAIKTGEDPRAELTEEQMSRFKSEMAIAQQEFERFAAPP